MRGMPSGLSCVRNRIAAHASITPMMPPAQARHRDSARSWRIRRVRDPPSAVRMFIFAGPRMGARQNQSRDIAAGNQQHEDDRSREDKKKTPRRADYPFGERAHDGVRALEHSRVERVDSGGDRAEFRFRLRGREVLPQAPDGRTRIFVSRRFLFRSHCPWHPDVGRFPGCLQVLGSVGKGKARRHYADNPVRFRVEYQLFADYLGVAAEARSPQRVPDHSYLTFSGVVVIRSGDSAELRRDAKNVEELSGNARTVNADGAPATRRDSSPLS